MNQESTFSFEEKNYKIIKPTNKIRKDSDSIYAKSYRRAIADGLFLEAEIDNIIKSRGIKAFNDAERSSLDKKISALEAKFTTDSFLTKEDGIIAYEEITKLRREIEELEKAKRELSSQSASLFAENERFNYLVFSCSKQEDGSSVWDSFEDYKDDVSELAVKFASEMLNVVYDGARTLIEEINKIRPENVWMQNTSSKEHTKSSDEKKLKKKSK